MATDPIIGITLMAQNQDDRYLTVNDSIVILAALAGGRANQVLLNAPPGSPAEGDVYVCGTAPTGAWASNAEDVAIYYNSAWVFVTKKAGMRFWDQNSGSFKYYSDAVSPNAWVAG